MRYVKEIVLVTTEEVIKRTSSEIQLATNGSFMAWSDISKVRDEIYASGGEFAFNDALFISGAIQYYAFTGDKRPIRMAIQVADWDIANSTPAGTAKLPSRNASLHLRCWCSLNSARDTPLAWPEITGNVGGAGENRTHA